MNLSTAIRRAPDLGMLAGIPIGAFVGYKGVPASPRPHTVSRKPDETLEKYHRRIVASKRYRQRVHKQEQLGGAVGGALSGIGLGYVAGRMVQAGSIVRDSTRMHGGNFRHEFTQTVTKPIHIQAQEFRTSLSKLKTKLDATALYRNTALKTHPDKGGVKEAFQDVSDVWRKFQKGGNFDKLAFLRMIYENSELEKIAKVKLTLREQWKIHDIKKKVPAEQAPLLYKSMPTVGALAGAVAAHQIGGFYRIPIGIVGGGLVGGATMAALMSRPGKWNQKSREARQKIKDIMATAKRRSEY